MIDFNELAEKQTETKEGIDFMDTCEKVTLEDAALTFPDGFTIEDFGIINGDQGDYAVCKIKGSNTFCFGSQSLNELFKAYVSKYDGDLEACRADFKEYGGITVKLEKTKTKSNRSYWKLSIIR